MTTLMANANRADIQTDIAISRQFDHEFWKFEPIYEVDPDRSIELAMNQVDMIFSKFNIKAPERGNLLKTKLNGEILDYFNAEIGPNDDWPTIVKKMINRFKTNGDKYYAEKQLAKLKQQPGESLTHFRWRCMPYCYIINPKAKTDKNICEELIMRNFVGNLRDDYQTFLLPKITPDTTLDQICQFGKDFKANALLYNNDKNLSQATRQFYDKLVTEDKNPGNEFFGAYSNVVDAQKLDRKPMICFKCNKPGHIARNCYSNKQNFGHMFNQNRNQQFTKNRFQNQNFQNNQRFQNNRYNSHKHKFQRNETCKDLLQVIHPKKRDSLINPGNTSN